MIKFELDYLLRKNRISFDQLVKETNINSSVLADILYNRIIKIDIKVINKLCQYFDCDIDELMNMDNERLIEPARELKIVELISISTYTNFKIFMKEKGYVEIFGKDNDYLFEKDTDFIVIKLYSILTKILEEKYDKSTDKFVSIYRGDQYITTYSFESKLFTDNCTVDYSFETKSFTSDTTNCKIFNIDDKEVFEMFNEKLAKYGLIIQEPIFFEDMISLLFVALVYNK